MRIGRPVGDQGRPAKVLVLLAVLIFVLMAFLALAVDVGMMIATHVELQNAADAAALAAASQVLDRQHLTGSPNQEDEMAHARQQARRVADSNEAWRVALQLDDNTGNDPAGDVVVGYLANPTDLDCPLTFNSGPPPTASALPLLYATSAVGLNVPFLAPPPAANRYVSYNSVRVRTQRSGQRNGSLDLSFARALGVTKADLEATATATYEDNIRGFSIPPGRVNRRTGGPATCKLLPFALDVNTYGNVAAGRTWLDLYRYDPAGPRTVGTYPNQHPGYSQRISFAYPGLDTYIVSNQILTHPSLDPVIPNALGSGGGLLKNTTTYIVSTAYDPNDLLNPAKAIQTLFPGDNIKEGLLVPLALQTQLLGQAMSVGNFGTLFLGTQPNGPVSEVQRQIVWGPTAQDLANLGHALSLGPDGTLAMKGDPLVPAALKEALESIRGQPRIIPLYRPRPQSLLKQALGSTVDYEIVGFGGIVIIEVFIVPETPGIPAVKHPITGNVIVPAIPPSPVTLKVLFQPELVIDEYAVGGGSTLKNGGARTSLFVYRPLRLSR